MLEQPLLERLALKLRVAAGDAGNAAAARFFLLTFCLTLALRILQLLQSPELLQALLDLDPLLAGSLSPAGRRLLQRLQNDAGQPVCCWSTAELAKRLGIGGPPALAALVAALRTQGHHAQASGVMAGQLRTDAPLAVLLQQCVDLAAEGP